MGWFDFLGSLGGGESGGSSFAMDPSQYSLSGEAPAIQPPSYNLGRVAEGVGGMGAPETGGASGAGGWRGILDTVGGAAKTALPIAQIGGMIGGGVTSYMAGQEAGKQNDIALRAQKQREQLTNQAAAGAATPLTTYGQSQIDAATKGELLPADRAKLDELKAGWLQQIYAYLAHSGGGDSSSRLQWEQYIDRQLKAMESEMLRGYAQGGTGALAAGGGILTNAAGQAGAAAQQAGAETSGIDQLIQSANAQMARLNAAA